MSVAAGIAIIVLTLPCWLGQILSWMAPSSAERLGLTESRSAVDAVYHADITGEAAWDTFTLWTMPAAGALLALDVSVWTYFGLVGGGMYLYFAGRGIVTRIVMLRHGVKIGTDQNVKVGFIFLGLWGVVAAATIAAAAAEVGA